MGHRLTRITTRTGDAGETGLGDGSRVPKDSLRIAALGEVDELNSVIGVVLAESDLPEPVRTALVEIQHDLFDLGGEISVPGYAGVRAECVTRLENLIERYNADLPPLKEFILPGGSRPAALAHVGRTVCRRAERAVIAAARESGISQPARVYLNRLSDLLFIFARVLNRHARREDVLWIKGRAG